MWEAIVDFFTGATLVELLFIYFARVIEVSLGTLRIILVNKGYRKIGVIFAFIEVLIWVFVASRVIAGISEAPIKGIVYSLGFASGVFLGSKLESKMAFGKVLIQAITGKELGIVMANSLRSQGFGVTVLEAHGKDSDKSVLMIYTNRKEKDILVGKIKELDEHAMIIVNDVTTLEGGYIQSTWKRFVK
jgi:uncharacterized protein YebE (UPF0316 family)